MRAPITALTLLFSATAAIAYDPIVLERGWVRAAQFTGENCIGEVGTNGQVYVLAASGFAPGETVRLRIENGDMPPIDRLHRADGAGEFEQYYIPFRYNRGASGTVFASVTGQSCTVPLSFDWQRASPS